MQRQVVRRAAGLARFAGFPAVAVATVLAAGAGCGSGSSGGAAPGSAGPGDSGAAGTEGAGQYDQPAGAGGGSGGMDASAGDTQVPADPADPAHAGAPTWHADVAPIVAARCMGCHQTGGIGPFALTSYASAQRFAVVMATAVAAGRMPPWQATETEGCQPRFGWKDDQRLTPQEKSLLARWAAAGAPEGTAAGASAPVPASLSLANPSLRTTMARPFSVEGQSDVFRCFPLPHEFAANSWITGLQVVPGNPKVVHHVLVWLDSNRDSDALVQADGSYPCFGAPGFSSQLLGAWAPGAVPNELRRGPVWRCPRAHAS